MGAAPRVRCNCERCSTGRRMSWGHDYSRAQTKQRLVRDEPLRSERPGHGAYGPQVSPLGELFVLPAPPGNATLRLCALPSLAAAGVAITKPCTPLPTPAFTRS